MTLTLPIPPAPSTDDDWIDDIKTAARMVGVPAEFPPPEPPLDHPVADLSNTACPDCGWFVHYLGNPQHANCKSMQIQTTWQEHDELMRATEEYDRFLDALEHTELRAHVVRLVQPFIAAATSPYELLWRYMNGLRLRRHQPLAVRVA